MLTCKFKLMLTLKDRLESYFYSHQLLIGVLTDFVGWALTILLALVASHEISSYEVLKGSFWAHAGFSVVLWFDIFTPNLLCTLSR